jgi:EAL domain-containing protein (putative c-di-GMP-specific phosphodiesterase class I)
MVGISVGAVHCPTHSDNVEALIRHADLAMYSAKENGKNQFVIYNENLLAEANAIKQMENDLEKALLNDEFFLVYQPQFDVKSEKIIGVEALLRWRHPKRGILTPPAFISVAEASGMMLDIGRWILYEACRQNKEWQLRGFDPIRMSINVTSAQLEDLGFIMDLIDVVGETNLDPDYLEIEFIERAAINHEGNTIEFMNQLKMMKIHAAIDDFGTGYSSLSYISKFPIDKIKIDRMFIDKIHERDDNSTIVRSIISIAEHLGIEVLAEGVETKEELEFLVNEGCYLIQGYYFSKPLPAKELEKRLTQKQS